jgi:hypothetical protein
VAIYNNKLTRYIRSAVTNHFTTFKYGIKFDKREALSNTFSYLSNFNREDIEMVRT